MKRRVLATLLALCLGIGLFPVSALAEEPQYTGEYSVTTAEELENAINEINADISGTGNYVISLQADIACGGLSFRNNTTTIIGNGHTIDLGKVANNISVNGEESNHPVLILGKNNDAANTLTIRSNGGYYSSGDHFIVVGNPGNGSGCGTLKMHSGVTIMGAVTNNTFGGAIVVGRGGTFEMNGGLITKCGIDGGSVCFGGGVSVINGGVFIMSGGSIRDCFLNTEYSEEPPTYNLFFNYGAGAGVFVANGSTFRMTGGTIANNRICKKEGSNYESYGVGGGIAILAVNNDTYSVASRVEITGGSIENNYATMGGGGIAICGMRPMSGAIASPYTPPTGSPEDAAGLYISGTADSKVQIKNNSAGGWGDYAVGGGGILVYHLKDTNAVDIQNAEITGNSVANGPGGSIESLHLSRGYQNNLSVKDCTIKDNRALWGGGICMYNNSSTSVMSTTTEGTVITENTALGDLGGGISVEGNSQLTFDSNCAIYDNTAEVGADDIYKDATAVMTALPTAAQMREAVPGLNISGWYWDYKNVSEGTYVYPEGTEHPCARYSATNAVKYTPISPESAERYLKAVKVSAYTVSFDAQGGTEVESQTVSSGGTAFKPENPTKENYVFDTWKLGEEVYDFATPVTGDITLTAAWKEDRNNNGIADEEEPKYTVIYTDGVKGIEIFEDQKTENLLPGAATPAFQGTPSRPGYTFTGWSPEVAETVTADVTYAAQWHKNGGTTIRYTLTYETNGGNEIPSTTHAKNSVVSLDQVPVRENYTFTGWYEDEGLTKKITEITMTSDKTVYAGWEATEVPGMLNGNDHFAYVIGYPDGNVKPADNITRAEVATIFFRLLKDDVRDGSLTTANVFNDVNEGNWFNTAISTMAKLGIVNGRTADTFVPDAPITRAEFAAICARFDTSIDMGARSFTDIADHWAKDDIEHAASLGWIMGYEDNTFRPDTLINRAEAMTMINRVLCRMPEVPEDLLSGMKTWPDNSDTSKWYYLAVQEGTNSHEYTKKGAVYETWTKLTDDPDWSRYQS